MSPSTRKALVVAALLLVLLPVVLSACPLCKDNLEDQAKMGGTANELGRGFYYSILLMVSAPFLAIAVVAFLIYRTRRQVLASLGSSAPVATAWMSGGPGARS